jgi:hypothetical protein
MVYQKHTHTQTSHQNKNTWNEHLHETLGTLAHETFISMCSRVDTKAIEMLSSASSEDIVNFHDEMISYLKKMTGSNRHYTAFWKGFPQEVMEKSELELWVHQIVHYMSNGTYEPSEWTKERSTAFEHSKYHTITAGNEDKFLSIFTDLVSVNNSLTPDDLNVVKYFVSEGYELRFPEVVPFKETLCLIFSELSKKDVEFIS